MQEFTVTQDHLKLARRMNTRWDGSVEYGAPAIDPKRPYGNSDVEGDMRHILGLPEPSGDGTESTPPGTLRELHEEMTTVLQIALATGDFRPGRYVAENYTRSWQFCP